MINIEKINHTEVISFSIARINAMNIDEISEAIFKVFQIPNSKVIIDLTGVEYIDSSGFGCFLSAMRAARHNYCSLKFANPGPEVMKLFELLHLHTVFEIHSDLDTCIASFR